MLRTVSKSSLQTDTIFDTFEEEEIVCPGQAAEQVFTLIS